ncbi:Concanavalin A-like lectin/glucanase subgroup [Penicillium coprophilum]|uniref:Concanavalin A-like lectin/glucanase subgroup n=1 Tax=Penicillium coprophilum TaxID=36646 RepID=UPI00238D9B4B|nr:Concanavalin A-like lectin/glucanase subgroup [Penicillium coprophilum]KAJ5173631.1 Concanavalin A-like lectin/glucanase subgroup [Penicillium coprophilum]
MREDYAHNDPGRFQSSHLLQNKPPETTEYPPAYEAWSEDGTDEYSRWDPRGWSLKNKIFLAIGVVVVIVGVVVGAVLGVRYNRYPDYSKLNYTLKDNYSGSSFFDNFEYFTEADPTHGFVQYIDRAASEWLNLTSATDTSAVLKVDTKYKGSEAAHGRQSVRVTSNKTYADGLFIFDVIHTPYGCGTWPALWLTDPNNWPEHGEIDVVEATNAGTFGTQSTLHTSKGCSMGVKRKESGTVDHENCYYEANGGTGCGVKGTGSTYGPDFNSKGGGVYAMELRDAGIRVWQWVRSNIPSDITSGNPDPSTWGQAFADFPSTDCDIGSHFKNQSIIINISLCGDWAGANKYYKTQSSCPSNCKAFVRDNAASFDTAYWEFGGFKVYQAS